MEYIQFLLVIIIIMLLSLIISIGQLNKNIIKSHLELIDKLTKIQESIIIINTKEFMKVKIKDTNKK